MVIGNDQNSQTRYIVIAAVGKDGTVVDPLGLAQGSMIDIAVMKGAHPQRKASLAIAMRNIPGKLNM